MFIKVKLVLASAVTDNTSQKLDAFAAEAGITGEENETTFYRSFVEEAKYRVSHPLMGTQGLIGSLREELKDVKAQLRILQESFEGLTMELEEERATVHNLNTENQRLLEEEEKLQSLRERKRIKKQRQKLRRAGGGGAENH